MDTLRRIKMPEDSVPIIKHVLDLATTFIPYTVVFGIFWKIIDAIFKYASEGRDTRTIELIDRETKDLRTDMKDLTKSINVLSSQIERKF
jgi:hypothetical protein